MGFDRKSGRTLQLSCSIKLPALCTNSLPRYQTGVNVDKSKQIKVKTPKAGTWQGYRDQNQFRFLGIPYAEPPLGNLRFQKPMRLNPKKYGGNNKANDATEFGHACMQLPFFGANFTAEREISVLGATQSEDCLYLNVFTPALKTDRAKGLPVMVYVHGGGFVLFAGSTPIFEPGNIVSRGGVVVVTLNYRLGSYGLFENTPEIPRSKAPGNLASRDQIAALRWVHDNIAAFGGDPSQVTIFGESAGGWSMRALLSAPSAFGLYKNVISQSDPIGIPFSSPKFSSNLSKLVMQNLNCTTSDLACAQNKTTDQMTAAQVNAVSMFLNMTENQRVLSGIVFLPTVDKSLIPADFADLLKSGKYNKKANVLWGFTKDEANAFVTHILPDPVPLADIDKELDRLVPNNRTRVLIKSPYYKVDNSTDSVRKAFGHGLTDYYWICPYLIFSRAGTVQKSNFYTYQMDYGRSAYSALGVPLSPLCEGYVCHADDLIPSFGSGDVVRGIEQTGDDARFARQVIDRFTTFAKTGNPNPPKNSSSFGAAAQNPDLTRVQWPKYDQSNPVYSFALANSSVTKNGDAGRCEWLSENTQFDYQVNGPGGKFVPIFPPMPKPPTSSTNTGSGTTLIQTPSSVSASPTATDTITTTGSESETVSVSASPTPSDSASLTTTTVVPTATTTDAVTMPPMTSA
ncbi:Carboxylesterase family-domain-containing protein [Linnemannia elongata]|nr:Carboxylesterase family-domain-containing protein [Linnemannia elongata]